MNWNERYAIEKYAGGIRKKVMEMGLRALPGVGKGTGKALAEGAETLLSGGTVEEAVQHGVQELGPIGQSVTRALKDPNVQRTVTKGIDTLKKKIMGPSATPATPYTYTPDEGI